MSESLDILVNASSSGVEISIWAVETLAENRKVNKGEKPNGLRQEEIKEDSKNDSVGRKVSGRGKTGNGLPSETYNDAGRARSCCRDGKGIGDARGDEFIYEIR